MSFTWSFSSLKDYVNCPRQYHEVKVLKRFVKAQTEQMLYGTNVHQACEDYVSKGKPLGKHNERFKPVLDTLTEIPGVKLPEYKMALDSKGKPCSYEEGYWVRGIADLVIIDKDLAHIIDYKTGSNRYADPKQLKLMALMVFAHFSDVKRIKAGLLFIVHDSFLDEEYKRDDVDTLWGHFHPDLARLQASYDNDVWNPKNGPLCGWCPVKTCEFYKERR